MGQRFQAGKGKLPRARVRNARDARRVKGDGRKASGCRGFSVGIPHEKGPVGRLDGAARSWNPGDPVRRPGRRLGATAGAPVRVRPQSDKGGGPERWPRKEKPLPEAGRATAGRRRGQGPPVRALVGVDPDPTPSSSRYLGFPVPTPIHIPSSPVPPTPCHLLLPAPRRVTGSMRLSPRASARSALGLITLAAVVRLHPLAPGVPSSVGRAPASRAVGPVLEPQGTHQIPAR